MGSFCPTVMVVDDEAEVRESAKKSLESHGFQVLIAKNGVEALLLGELHPGPIHALITDMEMPPYMGGFELARALKRIRPELAILFLSKHPADDSIQEEVAKKLAGFLAKPFRPDDLVHHVRELLQPKSATPNLPAAPVVAENKQEKSILLFVPDGNLRNGIAVMLRLARLHVLEARNIGEALGITQWHVGPIGLMLADRNTMASLPLELSERLVQDRPEMRILSAATTRADGRPVSERVRKVLEEWGWDTAGEK